MTCGHGRNVPLIKLVLDAIHNDDVVYLLYISHNIGSVHMYIGFTKKNSFSFIAVLMILFNSNELTVTSVSMRNSLISKL